MSITVQCLFEDLIEELQEEYETSEITKGSIALTGKGQTIRASMQQSSLSATLIIHHTEGLKTTIQIVDEESYMEARNSLGLQNVFWNYTFRYCVKTKLLQEGYSIVYETSETTFLGKIERLDAINPESPLIISCQYPNPHIFRKIHSFRAFMQLAGITRIFRQCFEKIKIRDINGKVFTYGQFRKRNILSYINCLGDKAYSITRSAGFGRDFALRFRAHATHEEEL